MMKIAGFVSSLPNSHCAYPKAGIKGKRYLAGETSQGDYGYRRKDSIRIRIRSSLLQQDRVPTDGVGKQVEATLKLLMSSLQIVVIAIDVPSNLCWAPNLVDFEQ